MKPAPGQLSMFGEPRTARHEHDAIPLNSSVPEHEAPRLRPQHHMILAALRDGPKTNLQLELIAQRFSARLGELRKAGYAWTKRCIVAGIYEYRLIEE